MDNLEEFVRKNREELDKYTPSARVWRGINREINGTGSLRRKWLAIAAMIVVVLGSAIVIMKSSLIGQNRDMASGNSTRFSDPRLQEAEIYYNNLLNSLYKEASPILTSNPEIASELRSDISQLDSISLDIRKDLKDNVANQEVIEALIRNYSIKIQLLQEVLNAMKEDENNKDKTNSYGI